MYPWVTHTHCHLGGECPHKCSYCYVSSFPFKPEKYQGSLRLIDKEFSVKYGTGKTIFIENCNDLFAEDVPGKFIVSVIGHCNQWPDNTYVFQTKNPRRYIKFLSRLPEKSILGCTIETNRGTLPFSTAPFTSSRAMAMEMLDARKFITVEPIMDFDPDILIPWIIEARPEFVNIGADSKGHNLPEPPEWKIIKLIHDLKTAGIEIREKHNLNRMMTP
jgi:DNA repair photolyase